VRADDFAGSARLAREIATPIQIGENFMGPEQMAQALAAGACDFVMPDAQRIGGVTGWMRAAALAQGAGMEMSSHLFPRRAATCSPPRQPATGSSSSTGPRRFCRTAAGEGRPCADSRAARPRHDLDEKAVQRFAV